MALRIISAEERLAESRGIKAAIFGGSGQGKTSLLWTLPADSTIFMDLEAGANAINARLMLPVIIATPKHKARLGPDNLASDDKAGRF